MLGCKRSRSTGFGNRRGTAATQGMNRGNVKQNPRAARDVRSCYVRCHWIPGRSPYSKFAVQCLQRCPLGWSYTTGLVQHLISYSAENKPLPPGIKGGLLIFSFTFSIYLENFPSSLIPPAHIIIQVIENSMPLT